MLIRTQFLLPQDIYEHLKLEATINETSMSKIVVDSIKMNIPKKKRSGIEFLKYLATNSHNSKKIPKDLSTNDDYLYSKKAHYGIY
jgi:hypothetical protein